MNELCSVHAEKIEELQLGAARTEVHLQHINETLAKLDAKMDKLDAKVEGLVLKFAEKPSKRLDSLKSIGIIFALGLAVGWGPKAVAAVIGAMK